jgi:hypothetical protein
MNRYKRLDKRRLVLTPEGWKKLQEAICQAFGEAYMDKPPFQKLSERTQASDNSALDPDTVSRIWKREKAVYRSSLERLFSAFGLTLNPSDDISVWEDLNDEISRADTRVIAKPHQELQEAIKPSASTRSSTPGVNSDWWRNIIPQMTRRIENSWLPKDIQAMRVAVTNKSIKDSWLPKEIQAMRQCLHTLS